MTAARQEADEMREALAAHHLEPFELGQGLWVIIDPKIEIGPVFVAVDDERSRLLAALVAADSFPGAQGRDQAARKGRSGVGGIGCLCRIEHMRTDEHVAGDRALFADTMPAPVDASRPGVGGEAAPRIHDLKLAMIAAI